MMYCSYRLFVIWLLLTLSLSLGRSVSDAQVIKREALKAYPYSEGLFYWPIDRNKELLLCGMYRDGKDYIFYGCGGDTVYLYRPDPNDPSGLQESTFVIPDQVLAYVCVKRFQGQNKKADGLRVVALGNYRLSVHSLDGQELYATKTDNPVNSVSNQLKITADPNDTHVYFADKRDSKSGFWALDLNTDGDPARVLLQGVRGDPKDFARTVEFKTSFDASGAATLRSQVISSKGQHPLFGQLISRGYYSIHAVIPGTDLAAAFRVESELSILSLARGGPVRKIQFGGVWHDRDRRTWTYADPDNDQFIFVGPKGVLFLPYQDLDIEAMKPFVVGGDFPELLPVGKPARIELAQFDPADSFEIKGQPEGMQLDGNSIVYTPPPSAAEQYEVDIALIRNNRRAEYKWTFRVEQQTLELDFDPVALRVARSGRYAVLSGNPVKENGEPFYQRLAVIDLDARKMIADKQIDPPLSKFDVTDDFIFCATRDGVVRYKLPDLQLDESSGKIVKYPVKELRTLGENRLVVSFPRQPAIRVDQDSLRVVTSVSESLKPSDSQTSFGFLDSGMLLDSETAQPRLLIDPSAFLAVAKIDQTPADCWHPFYPPIIATEHLGYPAYAIPTKSNSVASPLVRMAKALGNVCLETIDPGSGDLIGSYPLLPVDEVGELPFTDFQFGTNVAVANRGRQLFIVRPAELSRPVAPFHIVPKQDQFIVSEGALSLKYEADGATEFRISSPAVESLQQPQSSDNGTFNINLSFKSKPLWRQGLTELDAIKPAPRTDQAKRLSAIFKRQQRTAKLWFGQDIRTLLLPIRLRIEATNAVGETALLEHYLLLQADPKRAVDILRYFESTPKADK